MGCVLRGSSFLIKQPMDRLLPWQDLQGGLVTAAGGE